MDYKEKIQDSIEFIEENLSEKISLDKLAGQTFLSKFYYHRVFHELVGETVMTYIRKRRLTEAAKDLTERNMKIVDVAMKYQFGSPETFTRAFKRMFNISPREFKRVHLNVLQYKKIDVRHRTTATICTTKTICRAA